MKRVPPLLVAVVLLASRAPRASACPMPPLPELANASQYVALARVVGHRDVRDVRVTEYEVVRAFKGEPPARFVLIGEFWKSEEEEPVDMPEPTGLEVLFLTSDPEVRAPWKDWEALARATNGLEVLDVMVSERVLLWRDVVGITDPQAQLMASAIGAIVSPESKTPTHVLEPLEAYLDRLAEAVEHAADAPPPGAEASSIR